MDELHASIAAHLRREWRGVSPQDIDAPTPRVPRCRYCGRPLDRDEQRHELGLRRAAWACTGCFLGSCGR